MYTYNINLNQMIQTNNIAYIKFFSNLIAAVSRQQGSAEANSYAGGIQGSLAIYTRKSARHQPTKRFISKRLR